MRTLSENELAWVVGGQNTPPAPGSSTPPPSQEELDRLKKQQQEQQARIEQLEKDAEERRREELCEAIWVGGGTIVGAGIGGGIAVAGAPPHVSSGGVLSTTSETRLSEGRLSKLAEGVSFEEHKVRSETRQLDAERSDGGRIY